MDACGHRCESRPFTRADSVVRRGGRRRSCERRRCNGRPQLLPSTTTFGPLAAPLPPPSPPPPQQQPLPRRLPPWPLCRGARVWLPVPARRRGALTSGRPGGGPAASDRARCRPRPRRTVAAPRRATAGGVAAGRPPTCGAAAMGRVDSIATGGAAASTAAAAAVAAGGAAARVANGRRGRWGGPVRRREPGRRPPPSPGASAAGSMRRSGRPCPNATEVAAAGPDGGAGWGTRHCQGRGRGWPAGTKRIEREGVAELRNAAFVVESAVGQTPIRGCRCICASWHYGAPHQSRQSLDVPAKQP